MGPCETHEVLQGQVQGTKSELEQFMNMGTKSERIKSSIAEDLVIFVDAKPDMSLQCRKCTFCPEGQSYSGLNKNERG